MKNERDLLQRAQQLDVGAMALIFDEYYDSIYRYIYFHIHHEQTAEDLSAKVFQRLLEKLQTGHGPEVNLKSWLFRVAYHLIVDDSRRQQYRNHDQLIDNIPTPDTDIEQKIFTLQAIEKAYLALANLTSKQRDIIVLRYLMELTPMEIAEILDVSVGSVKALQHRGLEALRQELHIDEQEITEND